MLCASLLLVLLAFVRAEWPPSCTPSTRIIDNAVQLTSESTKVSECSFSELYKDETYVRLSRFYKAGSRVYKQASDSKIALTVKSKTGRKLFALSIHSDKITSDKLRCFGIFQQKEPWFLKVSVHPFMDLRKTVVSVASSRTGDTYRYCFQFELDDVIDSYMFDVGAYTESGMEQRIYAVETSPPKEQGLAELRTRVDKLEKKMEKLDMKVWHLDDRLAEKNVYHTEMLRSMSTKHHEMKKTLKTAESRNDLNVRHYSYFFTFLFMVLIVLGIAAIKFIQYYIHKRDKIF